MKLDLPQIEAKKPVWMALSEFYLDTELTSANFRIIASTFKKSEFSLKEIQAGKR